MRRFVLGTAGHVDHGKTTLVRALTGVDTDRLPEEKRRGITIELGFAPFTVDEGIEASVIDVPGHRRLVHAMIAGAAGMEVVLLVVAADEGVMPQTREHLAVCELLGIRRAVVAITKIDRVERELAQMAGEEVGDLCRGRFEHEIVLTSAKSGEGIDEVRAAVARALRALDAPRVEGPAHLSVDRLFSVKGAGTVVTGTLVRGSIRVGEAVRVVGAGGARASAVRGLHVHDRPVEQASAPTRLAINLASLGLSEVSRGDVVTTDPDLSPTRRLDVDLALVSDVKPTAALEVYVGTARSSGRMQRLAARDAVDEGASPPWRVLSRLRLERSMAVAGGDRLVVRAGSARGPAGAVVGGGTVIDARPPATAPKKCRAEVLAGLAIGDAAAAARALIAERAPRPLAASDLAARFPISAGDLARAADKLADRGDVARVKDGGFVDRQALARLAAQAREITAAYHAEHPLDRGIRLETLRQKLGERAGAAVAAEAIRVAARKSVEGEPLVVAGDIARMAGFVEGGPWRAGGPLEIAKAVLDDAALKGVAEFAMTEKLAVPSKEVKAVLAKLVRDGYAVTSGGQWFSAAAVSALRERVVAHFATDAVLTIAQFKEMSGLGRKQAIPLLELFDREGTSLRKGDDRMRGPKSAGGST